MREHKHNDFKNKLINIKKEIFIFDIDDDNILEWHRQEKVHSDYEKRTFIIQDEMYQEEIRVTYEGLPTDLDKHLNS